MYLKYLYLHIYLHYKFRSSTVTINNKVKCQLECNIYVSLYLCRFSKYIYQIQVKTSHIGTISDGYWDDFHCVFSTFLYVFKSMRSFRCLFSVNSEQITHIVLEFLLLTLSRWILIFEFLCIYFVSIFTVTKISSSYRVF